MKIIYGLRGFKRPLEGSVLAIGVFDGVHVGHKKIIETAVKDARRRNIKSVVLTFDPHPTRILHPKRIAPSLISLGHRIKLIERLGVDMLVVLGFSRALAELAPEDFVRKVLVRNFGIKEVCVGDNFYFGKGGHAGVDELKAFSRLFGFKVSVIKSIKVGRNIVSSSLIRKLITSGDLGRASKLLGRDVSVLGTVVSGARFARELGYPTANLNPHHEVIPPVGVYAVFISFKEKLYKGVLNIGLRPTFYSSRDQEPAIEVHIFDFNEKIYGHDLEVFFIKKLRDETAFSGKDELVEQIKKDEITARNALKGVRVSAFFALIFLFMALIPQLSMAQPLPPAGSSPGSQATRFEAAEKARQKELEKKKPKAPEIEIEKERPPASAEAGPAFVLKGVKVTGSTLFKEEDFKPSYDQHIGKEVVWTDIENIVEKIKDVYKKKGYLTTIVYIPEQDMAGGEIEIKIQEGKVGEVTVEGNKWFSEKLIKEYFHTKKNEILNAFKLQKDLLRLNQNSDLEVRAVIGKGKEPSLSDVILKVKDKLPYHAGGAFDNQGTRLVGKLRTSVSSRSTNLTGNNDSLYFNTLWSALSQGSFASYVLPIDTYGTKVGMDFVVFDTMLGQEYKGFQITGNTQTYTPKISAEMHLSEDFQASGEAGMYIKSIKRWVQGNKSSDDQLRMPYAGLDFMKIDSFFGGGQTSLTTNFIFSTSEFLGASRHDHGSASRPGTGGFFFQYLQILRRTQKMPFDSYVSIRTQFMNATNTLPSSEQIQFGGAYTVRGYPEGDYSADYGAGLNVDWVFPFPFIPKDFKLPYSATPLRHQFEPVIFMDMAGGKIKKPMPGERETKFLMGLGGGLKVRINSNLFLTLSWAERAGDRPTQNQGPSNFHITFQGEI